MRFTGKGQFTIPKTISDYFSDYLNLDTGSKIDFVIDKNGEVKVIALKVIALNIAIEISGILYRPDAKTASLADME